MASCLEEDIKTVFFATMPDTLFVFARTKVKHLTKRDNIIRNGMDLPQVTRVDSHGLMHSFQPSGKRENIDPTLCISVFIYLEEL
jgi:hypothetical protein